MGTLSSGAKWLGEHSSQPNIIIKKDWLYLQSPIHFHGMVGTSLSKETTSIQMAVVGIG
jgi:hypothetical protein